MTSIIDDKIINNKNIPNKDNNIEESKDKSNNININEGKFF